MKMSLTTLVATVCLFGIAACIDSDDILSNVLSGIGTSDDIDRMNLNGGLGGLGGGAYNGGAGGMGGSGLGGLTGNMGGGGVGLGGGYGGAYGGSYGGGYLDTFGGGYGDHDDKHISSVADLVNVVFGLGGHVVGRAGWIVRDALGALTNMGSLLTHSLDMGLMAFRLGTRLLSNSKIIQELKKPNGGKLFSGKLLNTLLNKRDGMLYSNHRLSDNDYGLMERSLGGLRGYGGSYGGSSLGGGMYGTSYPSYYQRLSGGRRDDD